MAQFAKRRLVCDYEIPCSCSLSRLATCFDLFSFLMSMNVTVFMCQFLAFFKERPKAEKQVSKLVPRSIKTKHFSGTKIKLKRKKSTQKLDFNTKYCTTFSKRTLDHCPLWLEMYTDKNEHNCIHFDFGGASEVRAWNGSGHTVN